LPPDVTYVEAIKIHISRKLSDNHLN